MNTTTATPPATAPTGVFFTNLAAMSGGAQLLKIENAMRDAALAAGSAADKATVTVKFTVIPNGLGAGDTPVFKIDVDVKKKLPEPKLPSSTFFLDDEGNLTRRNPRQDEIKFSVVAGDPIAATGAGQARAAAK